MLFQGIDKLSLSFRYCQFLAGFLLPTRLCIQLSHFCSKKAVQVNFIAIQGKQPGVVKEKNVGWTISGPVETGSTAFSPTALCFEIKTDG